MPDNHPSAPTIRSLSSPTSYFPAAGNTGYAYYHGNQWVTVADSFATPVTAQFVRLELDQTTSMGARVFALQGEGSGGLPAGVRLDTTLFNANTDNPAHGDQAPGLTVNDSADPSQNITSTAAYPGFKAADAFGAVSGAIEPGDFIFADGSSAGTADSIGWGTAAPVTLSGYQVGLFSDPVQSGNRGSEQVSLYYGTGGTADTLADTFSNDGGWGNISRLFASGPITGDTFRLEVTRTTSWGPRVTEIDAIVPSNTPPVAHDDTYATFVGRTLTVSATAGVLANDADPDGDALTVSAVNGSAAGVGQAVATAQGGSVTLNADGDFSYAAPEGYPGADTFEYTISDGRGGSALATVTIQVTYQPPIAVDDWAETGPNTAVTIPVLANDTDPQGNGPLTVVSVGTPANGRAALNSDGTVTYTPNPGSGNGTDTFSYTINNSHGDSATAMISVFTSAPATTSGVISGRVWDDFNQDGVQGPGEAGEAGVTVELHAGDGTELESVQTDSNGNYSFTGLADGPYYVRVVSPSGLGFAPEHSAADPGIDSDVTSSGISDTVTVNSTTQQDHFSLNAGLAGALTATEKSYTADSSDTVSGNVISDDTGEGGDVDPFGAPVQVLQINGVNITSAPTSLPSGATLTVQADGEFTYTGTPNFSSDSFTCTIQDSDGLQATAPVSVWGGGQFRIVGVRNQVYTSEAQWVSIPFQTNNAPANAAVTWSATNLRSGLSINAQSGEITGYVRYDDAGTDQTRTHNVQITAQAGNQTARLSLTWYVTDVNPLSQIPNRTDILDQNLSQVIASYSPLNGGRSAGQSSQSLLDNGYTLTFTNLPSGLSQSNTTQEAVSGTPDTVTDQRPVLVTLDNDGQISTRTFFWTVRDPSAAYIDGPAVVPGGTTYHYRIVIPGIVDASRISFDTNLLTPNVGSPQQDPVHLVSGVLQYQGGNTVETETVRFDNALPAKELWTVLVDGQPVAHMTIDVVRIQATAPTRPFPGTAQPPPAFTAGALVSPGVLPTPPAIENDAGVLAVCIQSYPTAWAAQLTATGPGQNEGIEQINMGFIQTGAVQSATATYANNRSLIMTVNGTPFAGQTYMDSRAVPVATPAPNAPPPDPVWYNGTAPFSAQQNSQLWTGFDAPSIFVPVTYSKSRDPNNLNPNEQLTATNVVVNFTDTIAAQTIDASNGANRYYYGYGSGSWTWSAIGNFAPGAQGNVWQVAAGGGVTVPSGWNPLAPSTLLLNTSSGTRTYMNSTIAGVSWRPAS